MAASAMAARRHAAVVDDPAARGTGAAWHGEGRDAIRPVGCGISRVAEQPGPFPRVRRLGMAVHTLAVGRTLVVVLGVHGIDARKLVPVWWHLAQIGLPCIPALLRYAPPLE